ncbi:glycosyltransferase family 4 protein [Planctomicrobium sp. SH661]|uniref:glycosyltransferase family 4 protein n=1 Tax=Planctomicrobium sp. SH661 TaxID=3448124 RepID=UPI003F5C913B
MRILLHDFGRFSYPWQLARSLAQRGHDVQYVYSTAEPARTVIDISNEESNHLSAVGISLDRPLQKRQFFARRKWEKEYGQKLPAVVERFRPDVVISANSPLFSQDQIFRGARRHHAKFVFWVQDLMSVAAHGILKEKIPVVGSMIGHYFMNMEARLLRDSDQVVLITEDFQPYMDRWKVAREKTHVVENWAPIEQLPPFPRQNAWGEKYGLHDKLCLMYAGTLGLKHDPGLLVKLAQHLKRRPNVRLVVAAEGSGVPILKDAITSQQLDNIVILPFQSFDILPQALASADVLIALLEPQGSQYCVPSKVLTYLCSGRPILLSVASDNLIARIVDGNRAGLVVSPDQAGDLITAADTLLNNSPQREEFGRNARSYAERNFRIKEITDRFEQIIAS